MKRFVSIFMVLAVICALFAGQAGTARAEEITEEYFVKSSRSYLPFSLIAAKVSNYVNTANSQKSFTLAHVSTGFVTTYGKLTHSSNRNAQYKAGVCSIVNGQPSPVVKLSAVGNSGHLFDLTTPIENLYPGISYFAYADNLSNAGYIHGTVSVDQR